MTTEFDVTRPLSMQCDSSRWNAQLAQEWALADGLGPLSTEHWRILRFLREHFVQYGASPPMHLACSLNRLDPKCIDRLFHGAREAWRLAGLPEPGSEAQTYMD